MVFDEISVFTKVVQSGSFSGAARLLGMPNTTVSAKVAALERRLGVTLIQRTTRKLNVTQEGEAYFRRCVRALEEITAAEAEVTISRSEAAGILRMTAPVDVGHTILPPLVHAFLGKNPKVSVELIITNRVVDLIGEGVDLAFRAGELEDSTMMARRFVSADLTFWATPAYLKKFGAPAHPRELRDHELIRFAPLGGEELKLTNGKAEFLISQPGRAMVDDFETAKTFVMLGRAMGLLPHYLCNQEARRGRLVQVLSPWRLGGGHLAVVYPAQRFVAPKVRAFLDHLSESEADGSTCAAMQGEASGVSRARA